MRTANWLMCLVVAGLATGCVSVKMNVKSGPIPAQTYSFVTLEPRLATPMPEKEQKVHGMVQEAIANNLAAKGVSRVEAGGDIIVAYLIIVGDGAITTYRDEYFGYDTDAPELMDAVHDRALKKEGRNYTIAGTLVIDILDGKTSKLLKRTSIESEILRNVSMDTRVARLQSIVDEALNDLKIVR